MQRRFARATGKVGAIALQVRLQNLVTIADAQIDSTPMVCIRVRLENICWVLMPFRKQILLGFQLQ
jgi:hypothetical protein